MHADKNVYRHGNDVLELANCCGLLCSLHGQLDGSNSEIERGTRAASKSPSIISILLPAPQSSMENCYPQHTHTARHYDCLCPFVATSTAVTYCIAPRRKRLKFLIFGDRIPPFFWVEKENNFIQSICTYWECELFLSHFNSTHLPLPAFYGQEDVLPHIHITK